VLLGCAANGLTTHACEAVQTEVLNIHRVMHPSQSTSDERLVPDLLRGRGRLICGDLDVGEEASKQMIITLQSLRHSSIGYQHMNVGLYKPLRGETVLNRLI
jgi:hypothetical protein